MSSIKYVLQKETFVKVFIMDFKILELYTTYLKSAMISYKLLDIFRNFCESEKSKLQVSLSIMTNLLIVSLTMNGFGTTLCI